MKHIVDGLGYQEACNGIKCIDCPFLDNEHNCKIGMYIRSQKVYQERLHGEWIGDGFHNCCSICGQYSPIDGNETPYDSNFCPNCGADMREGETNGKKV